jgi:hypothetical protein
MVTYFIDAFNLLYKVRRLEDSQSPHNDLIRYIKANKLTGSFNNPVNLVFDGYAPTDLVSEPVFNVIFSGPRRADDVIKEKVSAFPNKKDLVVVSDDNEIRDHARLEGARAMHDTEFLEKAGRKRPARTAGGEEKQLDEHTKEEITEELKNIWIKK